MISYSPTTHQIVFRTNKTSLLLAVENLLIDSSEMRFNRHKLRKKNNMTFASTLMILFISFC
jgi:hypothetical protein